MFVFIPSEENQDAPEVTVVIPVTSQMVSRVFLLLDSFVLFCCLSFVSSCLVPQRFFYSYL